MPYIIEDDTGYLLTDDLDQLIVADDNLVFIVISDHVLDYGLAAFADADGFYLCSQQPTDYTDATSTHAVGSKLESPGGIFTAIADASGIGRMVSLNAIVNGDCTASETASHWAAVASNGQYLLASGPFDTPHAVTSAEKFNLPPFDITLANSG